MKLGSLFSGGKDSVLALYDAFKEGHDIEVLITVVSRNPESYMYHVPNIEHTALQAEAMGLPIIVRESEGVKEEELGDLKLAVQDAVDRYGIEGIVSGAIYSNYQRTRIDEICHELGLESLSPLWKRVPREMLNDMVEAGFEVIISAVAAGGLTEEWLGRRFDEKTITELCELHNTCYVCTGGEGGEFETFVLDGPIFRKKLVVEEAESRWDGAAGVYEIKKIVLMEKS